MIQICIFLIFISSFLFQILYLNRPGKSLEKQIIEKKEEKKYTYGNLFLTDLSVRECFVVVAYQICKTLKNILNIPYRTFLSRIIIKLQFFNFSVKYAYLFSGSQNFQFLSFSLFSFIFIIFPVFYYPVLH